MNIFQIYRISALLPALQLYSILCISQPPVVVYTTFSCFCFYLSTTHSLKQPKQQWEGDSNISFAVTANFSYLFITGELCHPFEPAKTSQPLKVHLSRNICMKLQFVKKKLANKLIQNTIHFGKEIVEKSRLESNMIIVSSSALSPRLQAPARLSELCAVARRGAVARDKHFIGIWLLLLLLL